MTEKSFHGGLLMQPFVLLGIAFDEEEAFTLFANNDPSNMPAVVCVDIPRSRYCTCAADAANFFQEPK